MNILICDDDAATRFVLRRIVGQNLGWSVVECEDGVDALANLARRRFDLMLLDLDLPAFSGFEVLEAIRASDTMRDLPVVIVSQERRRDVIMKLKDLNISGFILKPIRADQIAERLAALKLTGSAAPPTSDSSELLLSPDAPAILVDGNLDYRHFFTVESERHGVVRQADSSAAALAMFRRAPVDLVFVGSSLGIMGAEMLVRKLREAASNRTIRVIGIVEEKDKHRPPAYFDDVMVRSFVPTVFASEFRRFVRPSGPVATLGETFPGIESEAASAVKQVFGMMLGADVEPWASEGDMPIALSSSIDVEVAGRLSLSVAVHVTEKAVDEVNAVLIGPNATPDDRAATASELVNLVAGRIHAKAGELGVQTICSLPTTVTHPEPAPVSAPDDAHGYLLRFALAGSGAPFAVALTVTERLAA